MQQRPNNRNRMRVSLQIIVLLAVASMCGCSNRKWMVNHHINDLAMLAIADFSGKKSRDSKGKIYYVKVKDLSRDVAGVSIAVSPYKIIVRDYALIGTVGIVPSGVIDVDGNLFYWRNDNIPLSSEAFNKLNKYDMLDFDSTGVKVVPEQTGFFSMEGVGYYFCKKDPSNFTKATIKSPINKGSIPQNVCSTQ